MSGNQNQRFMPVGVPLDAVIQQRQKQKVQSVEIRAKIALTMFQILLSKESQTPKLPRCRELINLAFATGEYFNTQAIEPLKEDQPTIVKDD